MDRPQVSFKYANMKPRRKAGVFYFLGSKIGLVFFFLQRGF
jgi:hypothetical protein